MKLSTLKASILVLVGFTLIAISTKSATTAQVSRPLPNPSLNFLVQEPFSNRGKDFTRYKYEVFNRDSYPKALFEASPALPPCGTNTNSARTWVTIYDQSGKKLNTFCALKGGNDLDGIWFALGRDEVPPSWVYIEFDDRKTNTKYKSNLAETTN